jgi:hypothetical protein
MVKTEEPFSTRNGSPIFATIIRGEIGNSNDIIYLALFVFGMHSHKPTMGET